MKHIISISLLLVFMVCTFISCAQSDKSKRPSPPAFLSQKAGDALIRIDYSQPSVKGRTIGVDLEPMDGKVWRAGANEATVFETDADIKVEGKLLPKGKYGFFTLLNGNAWTLIFNKKWDQWGSSKYNQKEDILRVDVLAEKVETFAEKMTFAMNTDGMISLLWGDKKVNFKIE